MRGPAQLESNKKLDAVAQRHQSCTNDALGLRSELQSQTESQAAVESFLASATQGISRLQAETKNKNDEADRDAETILDALGESTITAGATSLKEEICKMAERVVELPAAGEVSPPSRGPPP